ncbi:hypothetical protein [Gemmatimonas sp.]|jgi:hypothetical protein|uniref:hypothetical protein n=1 Tax=Gemmatimonas sp. TaxID=1962908 RepID=UPI0037C04CA8
MSRPIISGYEWRQRIRVVASPALFPVGCALTAQVRSTRQSPQVLTELTTANSKITRIDDNTIELLIPSSDSLDWQLREVVMDCVRTDTPTPQHLGFRLRVRVAQPVTRGLP